MADEFSESIAIVYPAQFTTHYALETPELLHSTILYLGEIPDVGFTKNDLLSALDDLFLNYFMWTTVVGKERFGVEQDVPVLLLDHDKLQFTYDMVSNTLASMGIHSASEFEYRPHVTVGDGVWDNPPTNIMLSPPVVWWGDDRDN